MKLQEGHQRETYHDSQSAWEAHGYHCYHCNCYNDPLVMNVFAHHEQAQPETKLHTSQINPKHKTKTTTTTTNQIKSNSLLLAKTK